MPTEPKPDSPTYYWLSYAKELQEVLSFDDPRYGEVFNFLYAQDMELLTVSDFCVTEPGNPSDITHTNLSDGTYIEKYKQAARQAAFYKLCQDA